MIFEEKACPIPPVEAYFLRKVQITLRKLSLSLKKGTNRDTLKLLALLPFQIVQTVLGNILLHFLTRQIPSLFENDRIMNVLFLDPNSAKITDSEGMTPLHHCLSRSASIVSGRLTWS
jgi:hypothetical protein